MKGIDRLLGIPSSQLGRTLRDALIGLRAVLEFALRESPQDPGAEAARLLLSELNFVLGISPVSVALIEHQETETGLIAVPVTSPVAVKLAAIKQELRSDDTLLAELGPVQIQADAYPDLWLQINYLLLRASPRQADRWRRRLQDAVGTERCTEAPNNARLLPGESEVLVFPGLIGETSVPGLWVSQAAPLDERVERYYIHADRDNPDLRSLAQAVSLCLTMIKLDADLHHALQAVDAFRVMPLRDEIQRRKFEQALVDYFGDVCRAQRDSIEEFKARLRLDEAIHSLVHYPPAQRTSWWGQFRQRCRDTLFKARDRLRARNIAVELRELPLSYRNAHDLTKDNISLDSGGTAGDVLASLRVWAKIEQQEDSGRAIYRA